MEHVNRIKREVVYKGTIVDFCQDTMMLPDGSTQMWDLVHHRMGAAAVVAIDDDGKLVMVKQYRPALDRETLEIPAGARDSLTEDTKDTALRELEEEAGYKAGSIKKLIELKPTIAYCDEFIDIYVAKDLIPSKQNLDPEEFIDVCHVELEELLDKIYKYEIQDGKTVSAILAYANIIGK